MGRATPLQIRSSSSSGYSKADAMGSSALRIEILRQHLPKLSISHQQRLKNLSLESNSQIFFTDLSILAMDLKESGQLAAAALLFDYLNEEEFVGEIPGDIRKTAFRLSQTLNGEGLLAERLEHVSSGFLEQATDPKLIIPMMGGSWVYQMAKTGSLARLLTSSKMLRWVGSGGVKALAVGMGFTGEVGVFMGLNLGIRQVSGEKFPGEWALLGEEFRQTALTLGLLKAFAGLGGHRYFNPKGFLAITHGSGYLGLVVSHSCFGDSTDPWLDSLITYSALTAGSRLGQSFLGPKVLRFQAELNRHVETLSENGPPPELPFQTGGPLAWAMVRPSLGKDPWVSQTYMVTDDSGRLVKQAVHHNQLPHKGFEEILSHPVSLSRFLIQYWQVRKGGRPFPRYENVVLSGRRMNGHVRDLQLYTSREYENGIPDKDFFTMSFRSYGGSFYLMGGKGKGFGHYAIKWFEGHVGPAHHPVVLSFLTRLWKIRGFHQGGNIQVGEDPLKEFLASPESSSGVSLDRLWELKNQVGSGKTLPLPNKLFLVGLKFQGRHTLESLGLVDEKVAGRLGDIYEKFPIIIETDSEKVIDSPGKKIRKIRKKEKKKYHRVPKGSREFKSARFRYSDLQKVFSHYRDREIWLQKFWEQSGHYGDIPEGETIYLTGRIDRGLLQKLTLSPEKTSPGIKLSKFTLQLKKSEGGGKIRLVAAQGKGSLDLALSWVEPYLGGFPLNPIWRRLIARQLGNWDSRNPISIDGVQEQLRRWEPFTLETHQFIQKTLSQIGPEGSIPEVKSRLVLRGVQKRSGQSGVSGWVQSLRLENSREPAQLLKEFRIPLASPKRFPEIREVLTQYGEKPNWGPGRFEQAYSLGHSEIRFDDVRRSLAHPQGRGELLGALWGEGDPATLLPKGNKIILAGKKVQKSNHVSGLRMVEGLEGGVGIGVEEFQIHLERRGKSFADFRLVGMRGKGAMSLALAWLFPHTPYQEIPPVIRRIVANHFGSQDASGPISPQDLRTFLSNCNGIGPDWIGRYLVGLDRYSLNGNLPEMDRNVLFLVGRAESRKSSHGGNALVALKLVTYQEAQGMKGKYIIFPLLKGEKGYFFKD